MSAEELQKRMYHIQELVNDLQEDLIEHGVPDFDTIVSDVQEAESEWNGERFLDSVRTLESVKDKIDEELKNVGDLDARDTIINWITDMPVGAFMDFA